jgi:formylglycine-generating enzyme required for sulfatase activity
MNARALCLAVLGLAAGVAASFAPADAQAPAAQTGSRQCPKCKKRYPLTLNFCERDGARLAGPPQGLSELVASAATGHVILSWKDASNDETAFEIQRRGPAGQWVTLARVNANVTTYADTATTAFGTHAYRVRAVNNLGGSGFVEIAAVIAPLTPPSGLTAKVLPRKRVELAWKPAGPADPGYLLERKSGNGAFAVVATLGRGVTTFVDENAGEGTAFVYRVKLNAGNATQYSNEVTASLLPPGLTPPSNLIVAAISQTQIRVDWTDNATAEERYEVERTANAGQWTPVATLDPNSTSYLDTGLDPRFKYVYRVRASGGGDFSPYCAEVEGYAGRAARAPSPLEPRDAASKLRALPSQAVVEPGKRPTFEFQFEYAPAATQLLARWERWLTPDGKTLTQGSGPQEALATMPDTGRFVYKAQVTPPFQVTRKARETGSLTTLVRQYFEGRRADGTRVVWSTTLTLNLENFTAPAAPAAGAAAQPPRERKNEKDGADMVLINSGGFHMGVEDGKPAEKPFHPVQITKRFYLYKTEVTNAQYRKFVEETGYREPAFWEDPRFNKPEQPVVGVAWEDARAYAVWAGGRLPTEAEWEFVARGKEDRPYAWGGPDPDPMRAVFGVAAPAACGVRMPGAAPSGAHDLSGNVAEWCADWFAADYYLKSGVKDPTGPTAGTERVFRGGSFTDPASALRTWVRGAAKPDARQPFVGFRVLLPA